MNKKVTQHRLKIWEEHLDDLVMRRKTFEVRKNDRDFKVGDFLILEVWNPKTEEYNGKFVTYFVTYILQGGQFGIEEGYVCMSIE